MIRTVFVFRTYWYSTIWYTKSVHPFHLPHLHYHHRNRQHHNPPPPPPPPHHHHHHHHDILNDMQMILLCFVLCSVMCLLYSFGIFSKAPSLTLVQSHASTSIGVRALQRIVLSHPQPPEDGNHQHKRVNLILALLFLAAIFHTPKIPPVSYLSDRSYPEMPEQ